MAVYEWRNQIGGGESPNSPIAIATKLGWVMSGPMAAIPKSKMSSVNLNTYIVCRKQWDSGSDR